MSGGRDQHPVEVQGVEEILEDGIEVEDLGATDYLKLILAELKVVNTHLSSMTDIEINIEEEDI